MECRWVKMGTYYLSLVGNPVWHVVRKDTYIWSYHTYWQRDSIWPSGNLKMERYEEVSALLTEVLRANAEGLTIVELADQTSIHRNVLAKYLKVLEAQGKVEIIRKGSKKIVRLSDRIPSSLLKIITPHPYLVFDRYLNTVLVSPEAGQYYPAGGDEEEKAMIKGAFSEMFLNPEIRDALHQAITGIRSSHPLDIFFQSEPRNFNLTTIPVVLDNGRAGSALMIEDTTEKNDERLLFELTQRAYDALLEDQIQFVVRFTPDYSIIYANTVFIGYIGINEEALTGSPFIPKNPEDSLISFTNAIQHISREHPLADLVMRRVVASGEFSWEQWRIRGLFDEKKGALFGYHAVGIEITAFKRNEQELRLYKNNLETLIEERTCELRQVNSDLHKEIFQREAVEKELVLSKFAMDNAHDLIFLLHPDGEIQYKNRRAQEILKESGLDSKTHIQDIVIFSSRSGISSPLSLDPDDISQMGRTVIKGTIPGSKGSSLQVEITISKIEEKGEISFCCIARDSTDRRKAEKELSVYRAHLEQIIDERTKRLQEEIKCRTQYEASLRANEERFRVMVEHSVEAVIIYDVKLNRFIDANRRAEDLFGYSMVDLLMVSPERFFASGWEDDTINKNDIWVSLQSALTGEVVVEKRAIWTHAGHVILCETRLVGLISEERELIRMGFIDITPISGEKYLFQKALDGPDDHIS